MNCPSCPNVREFRPRAPVSLWAPLAVIALVLGIATLASALTTDARDMKQRSVHAPAPGRAL